jgi:methanogenic corrinoid protein MtbC1
VELSIKPDINQPLRQALVSHVIPQLLDTSSRANDKLPFSLMHSEELGRLCLDADGMKAERFVRQLLAHGHDIESLYLHAIPEAARLFHDWWASDEIDFVSVTRGVFQLEQLVYSLSAEFVLGGNVKPAGTQHNALLVNPPGSHHSLGLLVLSQYFRRRGWQVFSANQFTDDDMLSAVRSEWVDLIGISLSEDKQIPVMKKLIAKLRQRCSNPQVQVMAGGPLLRSCQNLAELLGADFACLHADQAHMHALEQLKKSPISSVVRPTSA